MGVRAPVRRRMDVPRPRRHLREARRPTRLPGRYARASSWSAATTDACVASSTPAATARTSCCRATGRRSGKFIRCPYHAWVFTPTATSSVSRRRTRTTSTDPSQLLAGAGCRCEEWHGYVMANISGDAPPLERAPRRPRRAGSTRSTSPTCVVGDTHSYTLEANWKLIVENYHECFHCPTIHPELSVVADPESGTTVLGDGLVRRRQPCTSATASRRCRWTAPATGRPSPGSLTSYQNGVMYLQVGVNLLISLHPDYVMVHRLVPLAPDRTFVECQWLFPAVRCRACRVRPVVRRRLLGHHQPPGLDGLRERAARRRSRAATVPGRSRRTTRCRCTRSSPWMARAYADRRGSDEHRRP